MELTREDMATWARVHPILMGALDECLWVVRIEVCGPYLGVTYRLHGWEDDSDVDELHIPFDLLAGAGNAEDIECLVTRIKAEKVQAARSRREEAERLERARIVQEICHREISQLQRELGEATFSGGPTEDLRGRLTKAKSELEALLCPK